MGKSRSDKPYYIDYFGLKIKNTDTLNIKRENYAIINKKPSINLIYDVECDYLEVIDNKVYYTDDWCMEHYENCMLNYDLNMKYFESLDENSFNKILNKFLKKHKDCKEITDLKECDNVKGIYIMVLDKYKQIYIGQAVDIKRRILQHWSRKFPFDRLLYGNISTRVYDSIISINCFGAFDTTRIFVIPTYDLSMTEEKLVDEFEPKYLLNRTKGGINGSDTHSAIIDSAANLKKRKLN